MTSITVTLGIGRMTAAGFDIFAAPLEGVLTTDHAASSYGQPVLVVDGRVYGPAEVPNRPLYPYLLHQPDTRLDPASYDTDEEIRARRKPAVVEFLTMARLAGYDVDF